jgi:hypothetical protein
MDYSNSRGNIIPIFGYSKIKGYEQKSYKWTEGVKTKNREEKSFKKG